jgi:hypothetical protein
LVAAVDEAILSIASFFRCKNGGKGPRSKGAKVHDVVRVGEVSGIAPDQEDVAYDAGLGLCLMGSTFRMGCDEVKSKMPKLSRGKVAQSRQEDMLTYDCFRTNNAEVFSIISKCV